MPSALELAETLIARPSVTPDDAGCQALIASRLAACGFELHHLPHGPSAPPGHPTTQTDPSGGSERSERGGQGLARVDNLWAVHRGPRPGPCLVFAGHTDVVPTGPVERWASDPFVPTHRDGRLYGRGAADMKSGIAAMVVAAEAFARDRATHVGSLALLLTSDEEGPSVDGTVRVVEWLRARGERLDMCVVGEPTSVDRLGDTIKNGRRGSLTGRLRVRGVQGHVAYPQLAVNPIHRLAPALAEWTAEHWDDGNAHFPPTSFQVSNLHAGTGAGNVIPGEAVVDFNFRFSTASTPDALMARVHALLDRHALDYAIDWTLGGEPFLTEPGALSDALAAAIEAECGIRPDLSTTGGTSDGRFIARICPQVVEFGPVNASIHKIDEHVIAADVDRLARIYRHVMDTLLREAHVPHVPTAAGSS